MTMMMMKREAGDMKRMCGIEIALFLMLAAAWKKYKARRADR